MMRRASIFALLATAMTFAAEGEQYVLVHATVSHVVSVTLSGYGGARTAPGDFNLAINYPYTLNFTPATGYTPKGWEVTTNGVRVLSGNTTDAITINTLAYGGCSLLFYGQPIKYPVTLDRQDGSGVSGSVTATYDAPMPYLSGGLRIRNGYTFGGYWTGPGGTGTPYYNADGNSAQNWNIANSNTTLYAKWTPKTYNVTLNRRGGKSLTPVGGDESVTVTYTAPMPQASMPTCSGYTFGGYYAEINGGGTKYYDENGSSAANWTKTDGGTLHAYWIPNTYAVTLDRQGATNGTNAVTATYGSAMPSATMPTRDGYTFEGYYTGTGGSGTQYYTANGTSAQDWNIPSNTILYAKWTGGEYAVTLDKQSGTNGTSSVTATYGSAMPSIDVPTREGYAFTGYYADMGGTGTQYYTADGTSAQNWDRTSATTLYANWTGVVYTVTFNANGGTGSMEPLICTYGMPTNLPPCTFARDGWGFSGWTTNGATGVLFADGALVSNLTTTTGAQVELLACWSSDTYDVVFDARDWRGDGWMTTNGIENVNMLTKQVNVGDTWDLPVPTNAKPHLAFVGWKDDQGQLVVNGTMVPPQSAGATNLVAVWSDSLAAAVDAPTLEFRTFGTVGQRIAPVGDLVDPYAADWFPQTNFLYGSTNAAQSGALPVESLTQSYVSWLITTVEGKGVLSFSWKCDAQEEFMGAGDTIRFGLFDATLGITNEIARLKNHDDWRSVSYINDSQSVVSFAWAFVYTAGAHNGGGTGWVDRVTWRPEGSSGEETQAHSVPFTWLRTNFPEYENADEAALEALAETNSPNNKAWPNGESVYVWQDYWAGTDPNISNDLFRALIAVTNGVPTISWQPDLSVTGTPPRVYRVLCSPIPSASAQDWVEWPGPGDSGPATNRFFKVELNWEAPKN